MGLIRVILGDDHTIVRQGIRALLDSAGIKVEGEAADGRALVKQVQDLAPDLAIVDIALPLLNGIEATRKINRLSKATKVICLSMHNDKGYITQARRAGAWGYVLKDAAAAQLLEAIDTVMRGNPYFPAGMEAAPETELERITPREREVLQLIAEGKKNSEIAQLLIRSLHTVRNHRANIMRKLGVHSSIELVHAAERMGLVRLEAPGITDEST